MIEVAVTVEVAIDSSLAPTDIMLQISASIVPYSALILTFFER